mmetsp:Transcript_26521/g.39228  ORF Transcript_26521/g.39228 Transcript_26521/m.39228 type:complete len:562 (-) Transcript_26521:64-1749(-)
MMQSASENKRKRRRGAKARARLEDEAQVTQKEEVDELALSESKEKKIKVNSSSAAEAKVISTDKDTSNDNGGKRKGETQSKVPKQGEEGYMTKTQLRNAAKRRAKQLKRIQEEKIQAGGNTSEIKGGKASRLENIRHKRALQKQKDPSTRYIQQPKSAPIVSKAKIFFSSLNIPFKIHVGPLRGWRTVSKLPARQTNDDKNSCIIGLFSPGSHNIVAVPKCIAHHPAINRTIEILQKECDKIGVKPYDEADGKGNLRYVCMNVERKSGKVQVTIVWNSPPYAANDESEGKKTLDKFIHHLVGMSDSLQLHSLWVHFNGQWKHASNIFDISSGENAIALWRPIHGPRYIIERLDLGQEVPAKEPVFLHFPPNVFRQANLDAFTKIIVAIRKRLSKYNSERSVEVLPTCLELYGGVGTIGLNLVDLISTFTSSDENPHNKECFEKSVGLLSKDSRKKCAYISKNATNVIREENVLSRNCDVVIVDPPRKGLDDYVTQSFIDSARAEGGPDLLVYVSCGFDAFVRDCNKLLDSKMWKLDQGEGHLLFPGSDAIETLAFFRRKRS